MLARALGLTARLEAREAAAESCKPHEQRGITGPHGRLLIPVSPDTPFVASALRAAFQGLGGEAAARQAGLTPAAWLVELAVLVALPGAAEQPPHLDVLPRDALSMATLFLPLQETTAANGATVLYPAPPSEVAARCDWDAMQRGAGGGRTFSADGTDTADDTVGAAEARMRAEFAEDAAASAGLSMPVSSPWTRFSKPALGLGTSEHGAEGRRCAVDGLPLLPPRRRQSQRRAAGRAVRDLQRGQGGGRRCGDDGRRGWSRGPHVLFDGAAGTVPLPLRVFGCEALRRRSFWSWQGPLYPLRLLLTLLWENQYM